MRKCADMKYHFAAKLRIYPSSEQKHMIAVNDGVSRYVYNRMTANDRDLHAMKKAADMCPAYRERVAYLEQVRSSKKELVNTIPFLNEKNVDSLAVDNAIKNHNLAWKRFREVPGTGIPGFHKKSYEQSYQTNAHYRKGAASWEDGNVHFVKRSAGEQVPHLITLPMLGTIRFRCSGKVLYMLTSHKEETRIGTITVRRDNCGDYYAVLQISSDTPFTGSLPKTGSCVGIDMNLTDLYTDSNGRVIDNPKYGRGMKKKLAKAQRRLARMKESAIKDGRPLSGSSNYRKQRLRTAVLQRKVSRSREDYLQVQSKRLVESQDLIVSEDLKVKNLLRNHRLAYGISDVSWGRFMELLGQKSALYGKEYLKVPARYTTQTCSVCGFICKGKDKIPLGVSEWVCPGCGSHHSRNHNAAVVVLQRGLAIKAMQAG